MQGGNKARRWLLEQTEERKKREREGKEEQSEGGVDVLLNFNEYQGEFLLHIFFPCSLSFFFFSWDAPIYYMALNHCHTNEL